MTLNDYQKKAHSFSGYPEARIDHLKIDYVYPALGLAEEAGEVAGKYAKAVRDCNGEIDMERKTEIIKELGDVLWFVSELAYNLNVNLNYVANYNIAKLKDRKKRGVIHGSGDNR
jgi:NTP pyrophosphatase (non-canonical NTP hydrolase)